MAATGLSIYLSIYLSMSVCVCMVWSGLVWYGTVWFGMVGYGIYVRI